MTEVLDSVFWALSDATRRGIVERLLQGPATVSELSRPHDMSLPGFLKHLRVLEEQGWSCVPRKGGWSIASWRLRPCRRPPCGLPTTKNSGLAASTRSAASSITRSRSTHGRATPREHPSIERQAAKEPGEQPTLEITRHYDAPPERVWQAWTDPRVLSRWFGPGDPDSVTRATMDVRPGGAYSIAFRTPDGEEHRVSGHYEVVDAPARLSFSWAWQSTPDRLSHVSLVFEPQGGGTLMRFRHERFYDRAARDNHARGWAATLDKLSALLGPDATS